MQGRQVSAAAAHPIPIALAPGTGYRWVCSAVLFLSLEAIFVVPVKVYPFCFLLFGGCVGIWFLAGNDRLALPWRRSVVWVWCLAYLAYALVLFYLFGGDDLFALRLFVNVWFFLAASALFLGLRGSPHWHSVRNVVTWALFTAVLLSALQTLVNVSIGHLWLWPASIHSSDDAYRIQDVSTVVFGDGNKNIWATKTLITYLEFFALRGQRRYWQGRDKVAFVSFLFVLVYTSSRTAQLACVIGFACYMLRAKLLRLSLAGKAGLVALMSASMWVALVWSRVAQISNVDIATQGSAGDGLVGRVILWIYFAVAATSFSLSQVLFGHGVSAVTEFVSSSFNANNLQNVFMNQFFDVGIIGLTLYCSFLVFSFKSMSRRWRWLFVPTLLAVMSTQYFGFDPELMVFFAISALLIEHSTRRLVREGSGRALPADTRGGPRIDPSIA
jgi:hypothetical protein